MCTSDIKIYLHTLLGEYKVYPEIAIRPAKPSQQLLSQDHQAPILPHQPVHLVRMTRGIPKTNIADHIVGCYVKHLIHPDLLDNQLDVVDSLLQKNSQLWVESYLLEPYNVYSFHAS